MGVSEKKFQQIVDYLNSELDDTQRREMDNWLSAAEENRDEFRAIQRKKLYVHWSLRSTLIDKEADFEKINSKLTPRIRPLYIWATAASIIILLGLSVPFLWKSYNKDPQLGAIAEIQPGEKGAELILSSGERVTLTEQGTQIKESDGSLIQLDSIMHGLDYKKSEAPATEAIFNTLKVLRGNEYNIRLADGTRVWLNSDSELRYPVQFINEKREVYLTGEAFFEVAKDIAHPFIVNSFNSQVEVTGTAFNVSAYEDQDFVATTLVEGSVKVSLDEVSRALEPGLQSVIIKGQNEISVKQVNTNLYTSWVKGVYEFEDMELEYIMAQLSRWYNVDVSFSEETVRNIRFTGAIKRDKPFVFALDMIEKIADVEFHVEEDSKIIIGK